MIMLRRLAIPIILSIERL